MRDARRLADWVAARRWFRGKARVRTSAEIVETIALGDAQIVLLRIGFAEGAPETYVLPMIGDQDALANERFAEQLRDFILEGGTAGRLRAVRHHRGPVDRDAKPRIPKVEQSNSSIFFGESLALKVYRVLDDGPNPEVELGTFLDGRIPTAPHVYGALMIGESAIAVLQSYVVNRGDAWSATLESLEGVFGNRHAPDENAAHLLGRRTAEMHAALAQLDSSPLDDAAKERIVSATRASIDRTLDLLAGSLERLDVETRADAARLLSRRDALEKRVDAFRNATGTRTRIHGDYHLGQVLVTPENDYVIIDFEGEPARTLEERRAKSLALRDVAGMLRSYHYAAHVALRRHGREEQIALAPTAVAWTRAITRAFLGGWSPHLRADDATLGLFLIDKCLYEVGYELNNRPDWVQIPLAGAHALLDG